MPSPLLVAGAGFDSPPKYVPLHVNRWWTGLWTNRSPLRDAATTYLAEKYYSGARFESMIDGVNIELSPRLTPIRRPGNSVYNSQTFAAINDFYAFRIFDTQAFTESIKVIADTPGNVYDATGPNTKINLLTKSPGSVQTSFQSVGNTLYMSDGIDLKKFIFPSGQAWTALTRYHVSDSIVDANYNIQTVVGILLPAITVTFAQVASNILTVTFTKIEFNILTRLNVPVGSINYLQLGTFTAANNIPLTVASYTFVSRSVNTDTYTITYNFSNANFGPTAETGSIYSSKFLIGYLVSVSGTSGASAPSWGMTVGNITNDNPSLLWKMSSAAIVDWQPVGPSVAPSVINVPNTTIGAAWAANTYFNPSLIIIDSNGNVQLLTTAGTTAGSVPVWSMTVGVTTTDGSAVWTCQGTATRAVSTAYALGALIQVTFYIEKYIKRIDDYITLGPYTRVFKCTTAGTSSATVTGNVAWGFGSVQDGTVVWTGQGPGVTRTIAATSKTNIGNTQILSLSTQIIDSNGNFENLVGSGESGATPPVWPTQQGAVITDNQAVWQNAGPATAANTGAWVYGFAYKNSVTGSISQSSPKTGPIILAATSFISVSGVGDPNWATDGVDTIEIYRSVQGFTTLFFLADIPAPPSGGVWNYLDASPDPPAPSTTLNEFISADVVGNNAPPPAGMIGLSYYLSRVWGIVGEFVYYSSAPQQSIGVNTDNFPAQNNFQFPSTVTKLWPNTTGMIFFTNHGLYISVGVDVNGNPRQPIPFLEDIGLLSANCFTVNGSNPLLFTGDKQFVMLDPSSGVSRVGFPIEDILQTFDPITSYVTWHTKGPDQAAYIADGQGNWYRVNLTPAPETGSYSWSPQAQILGGFQCLKSIETAPGVKDLLLGSNGTTNTQILRRDPSTNADNGNVYPAFFTVGNIVLAQPGQAAEIAFITTEELNIGGTPVTLAVLADEVAGTFETMPDSTNDPPWATPSTSLNSLRWYFGKMQTPAWMRHLQVRFTWPAEPFQNEILSWSPIACLHQDSGT